MYIDIISLTPDLSLTRDAEAMENKSIGFERFNNNDWANLQPIDDNAEAGCIFGTIKQERVVWCNDLTHYGEQ